MRAMILILLLAATAAGDTFWENEDRTISRAIWRKTVVNGCHWSDYGDPPTIGAVITEANLDDYYVLRVDTIPVIDTTQIRSGVNLVFKDVPRLDTLWAPLIVVKLTPEQLERLMVWLEVLSWQSADTTTTTGGGNEE